MSEAAPTPKGLPLPDADEDVIVVRDLVKTYDRIEAVRGISFSVRAKEVFGFLGPNGAGKTTTIKILATLLGPTSGHCEVAGMDVVTHQREVRDRIGLVFQDPTLDQQLTAEENLVFHGMLYGLSAAEVRRRAGPLMEIAGLAERRKSIVKTYSGGMMRRLEIVRGLLHAPEVLFLDEPTIGLDPQSRAQMWEVILSMGKEQGCSIFMTTHYMEEAEFTQRIAIIDHGGIQAIGSPAELKRQHGTDMIIVEADATPEDPGWAKALGATVRGASPRFEITLPDAETALPRVIEAFGGHVSRVEVRRPTLETVFLQITGREIREEGPADQMAQMHRMWRRGR